MKASMLKRRHDARTLHELRVWRSFRVAFAGSALGDTSWRSWQAARKLWHRKDES